MLRGIPCFSIFKQLDLIYLNQVLMRYIVLPVFRFLHASEILTCGWSPTSWLDDAGIRARLPDATRSRHSRDRHYWQRSHWNYGLRWTIHLESLICQQATEIMDCDGLLKNSDWGSMQGAADNKIWGWCLLVCRLQQRICLLLYCLNNEKSTVKLSNH